MRTHPTALPDLVAFWDFQEPAGVDRIAQGPHPFRLKEVQGPIEQIKGGIWGPHAIRIKNGQWLRVKRQEMGALNIYGPKAHVSMVAWIQRGDDEAWHYIAGCWDHLNGRRQYAMYTSGALKTDFTTYTRTPSSHQTHGFVCSTGGASPGSPVWLSYATGKTFIEKNQWHTIGFTYDGKEIKVYVNGILDELPKHNPFPFTEGIFDGGPEGADFTVAQRCNWKGYPDSLSPNHGFAGVLGGLAVYRRALSNEEMKNLHFENKS